MQRYSERRRSLEMLDPLGGEGWMVLEVPARPESLSIVRLVLMSCGAAAGVSLAELFARSSQMVEAFTDALLRSPDAKRITVRTRAGGIDVELVPEGTSPQPPA